MSDAGAYRFHPPNETEREFLRVVTFGYPELQAQVENCEVDDYDPTGYLDVRVASGPPLVSDVHFEGPWLKVSESSALDVILWVNEAGLLDNVEVLRIGDQIDGDILARFIEAARASILRYRYPGAP